MRTPLRAIGRTALAVLLALATTTCTDQPTEPGGGHAAQVRFRPTFVAGNFAAGLPVDQIVVTVVRPATDTLLVKSAPFALTDSVAQLNVTVDLLAPSESLLVTLELWSSGTRLFSGTNTILVSSGSSATTPPAIPLTYVGPGANIAFLSVSPYDTILSFGDSLVFRATASDPQEAPVPTFYLHWYTTPAGVPIRPDGRIVAPNSRGSVMVHAWTPSGIEDSTRLTFMPVPTQLAKISGDLQSDTIGDTLTALLVVEVRAADNLPVAGVRVTFAAVTAGGSVVTTSFITDTTGRASTLAVLGDTARTYSYTASVVGVPTATFQATATAGPATLIAKVVGDAQSDSAGKTLPLPLVVLVTDALGNPVAGTWVQWAQAFGTGTVLPDSSITDGVGHAQTGFTLGAPGVDSITATISGTSAFVTFSETAVAGGYTIALISGNPQTDTVNHTLTTPMVVEVHLAGSSTPAPGVKVHWRILYGGGSLPADTTVTDSLGRAQNFYTLDTLSGAAEVLAEPPTAGQYVTFQITKVAAAPHHLAFVVAPPDTTAAGAVLVPQPVIEVRDTFNNAVPHPGLLVHAGTISMFASPPVKGVAPSGIQFTGSTAGGVTAATDSTGKAIFVGLVVTGTRGPDTYRFQIDSLALPLLTKPFVIVAGAPSSVIPYDGSGQTAYVDSLVAIAPKALVVDGSGNGVTGVTVTFVVTVGGGAVTGGTQVTDSFGYATVGSWRMGSSPGTDSLEARVSGATSGLYWANAQPLTPTIILQLLGTAVVGVGRTAPLQVRLSSPAPVGGVNVSVVSDAPGTVSVGYPTLSFAAGDSILIDSLYASAAGVANITANGPGYVGDTLPVSGSLNLISLPTTLNVPFGGTASIAVTLGQPAPVGGAVISLVSSDPSFVGVLTPTVTIPQGGTSANGTLQGVALGTVTVTATNPNFAPDQSTVSTTATLNIVNGSQTVYSTIPVNQTLEFRSAGALIAAPAGGLVVTLTARDTACVSVPATVTITGGLSSTVFMPTYAGIASLPCATQVVASYPGVNADSIALTVNPPPTSTLTVNDVGSGLATSAYGYLETGVPTPRTMVIRSLDTTKVLVAVIDTAVGSDSAKFLLGVGENFRYYYIRGKEGIVNDSAQVELSAPGYLTSTAWVRVRQPGVVLAGFPATTTTLSPPTAVSANIGLTNVAVTGIAAYQGLRPGGTLGKVITFTVTPSAYATLKDSSALQDTVKNATLVAGQYYTGNLAQGGVQYVPLGAGSTSISVVAPGYVTLSVPGTTIISAPTSTLTVNDVGSGLATSAYGYLETGVPTPRTMVIRSLDTTKVLVAVIDTAVGSDSAKFLLGVGENFRYYYIRGKEGIVNDSAQVELSAPGYLTSTAWVRVRQPGVVLGSFPGTATTLSPPTAVSANVGLPNVLNTTIVAYQGLRPGGTLGNVITFTLTPSGLATLFKADSVQDTVRTATLVPLQYYTGNLTQGGVQYLALATGTTTLSVAASGYVTLPAATGTTTISTPGIGVSSPGTLGAGLQNYGYFYLGASRHGGDSVWIKSSNPSVALLSPNNTTPGTDSIAIFVPDGQTFSYFYVQGVDSAVGTPIITVSANGFLDATFGVPIVQPGVTIANVPASMTSAAADAPVYAYIGVPNASNTGLNATQERRAGGASLTVTFTSATPGAATLVNTGGTGATLTAIINSGFSNSPYTVAAGGVAIRPVAPGNSAISVALPGFIPQTTATANVNVTP